MVDFVKYGAGVVEGCPPDAGALLIEQGLPRKVITIFRAAQEVVKRSAMIGGHDIAGVVVGFSREDDEIFLDFEDGRVWLLASWGSNSPILVNGGLRAFRESLVLVESRYPFYPADRDLDIAEHAEESLRGALKEIDNISTGDPDGFWSAFLDDVANGDYAGPKVD